MIEHKKVNTCILSKAQYVSLMKLKRKLWVIPAKKLKLGV